MAQMTLADQGLEELFGLQEDNLRRLESTFGVSVSARGTELRIDGEPSAVARVERLFAELGTIIERG